MAQLPGELKSERAIELWIRIQSNHFRDYVTVNAQITRLHIMGDEAKYLREYARANLPGRRKPTGSFSA
jgi:hypothetical protein